MAYCRNCGAEVDEKAVICTSCGVPQVVKKERSPIGYGILGFFMPIIGALCFVLWYDTKPKTAKYAAMGCLLAIFVCTFLALLSL